MRQRYTYVILLLLFASLESCKKEKVEDAIEPNDPVFLVEGTLGTEMFSAVAGDNNFYMSTFTQTVQNVSLFSGKLSDGNTEVELGIFDGDIDLPDELWADNLPDDLHFAGIPQQPVFQLSKQVFPNSNYIDQIKWYVNGQFVGLNTMTIHEPGRYTVCAEVSFVSGNEGIVCNDVIVGYQKNASSIMRHFVSPGGDLQVWLEELDVPVASVKWYMDDNFVSDEIKLIDEIGDEMHVVKAVVTYANGVVRTKKVLLDGTACGGYLDDFSIFENSQSAYFRDYAITLTIRKNGVEYTSLNVPNNGADFHILDRVRYEENSSGNPVLKIEAEIDCMLKNNTTGELVPFSGTMQFGIEVD
ncbi:MAG: hypothetical protein ACK47F_06625 [Flavobacteriales bacterium]